VCTETPTTSTDGSGVATTRRGLVELFYGISRPTASASTAKLLTEFRELTQRLFFSPEARAESQWDRGALLALVLQTRDLAGGKGEYGIFYLLVGELFMCDYLSSGKAGNQADAAPAGSGFTDILVRMMGSLALVDPAEPQDDGIIVGDPIDQRRKRPCRPYGSWKDYRAILTHIREMVGEESLVKTPFFKGCIAHMVAQLQTDHCALEADPEAPISLFAKWAPRERSPKHGWLAKYIARDLVGGDDNSTAGAPASPPARLARYRRWISALNRHLKTPEIYQCEGRWRDIDFNRDVPAGTLRRQRRAFQYPSWNEEGADPDRQTCRRNYLEYLRDCAQGTAAMRAGNASPRSLVRDAIAIVEQNGSSAREAAVAASALNLQWWESRAQVPPDALTHPYPIIPIVDTSCTMSMDSDDPVCAAIGIGLRLAETSKLGRRLVTFGPRPVWVNLDSEDTLTTAVSEIRAASSAGGNADVLAAFELVAQACVEADIEPNIVAGLCIVLLSDADDGSWRPPAPLHARIIDMFRDAGLRSSYARAYRAPHVVYWALRTRQPLPCSTTTAGVSLVSGYNPAIELGLRSIGPSVLGDLAPHPESAMTKALTRRGRYAWVWEAVRGLSGPGGGQGWLW